MAAFPLREGGGIREGLMGSGDKVVLGKQMMNMV
jgi:hypothetical protein